MRMSGWGTTSTIAASGAAVSNCVSAGAEGAGTAAETGACAPAVEAQETAGQYREDDEKANESGCCRRW